MPNPTDPSPLRRDWVLIVAVVLVAASTVIASFTAQAGLGERAGWLAYVTLFDAVELRLSWLLPLTVDAYGVAATRIATNKRAYSAEVRGQAFGHALAAVAVSVVANAVFHLLEAHVIVLGNTAWVLVVAVSIVPPVALGGLAHVLSVAARDEVETVTSATAEAVPGTVAEPATVETERVTETPAINSPIGENDLPAMADVPAVPDPFEGVPPQVGQVTHMGNLAEPSVDAEPAFSDQVQPEPSADLDAPYRPVALAQFLAEVASGEPPSVRTIKDRMGVGTDRARRLQAYLGGLVEVSR
ncbi:MAG TPA: hypothetical protein VFV66_24430 [Nonomuraea sp.]|nr:hypothetical protein [Nonomuraea sp.]